MMPLIKKQPAYIDIDRNGGHNRPRNRENAEYDHYNTLKQE